VLTYQTQFDNPIVVPAGVERILVTVSKFKNLYPTVAEILVAGTTVDTGESLYWLWHSTHYCSTKKPLLFQFQMQIFHQRYW
jgi:hypothetical protein